MPEITLTSFSALVIDDEDYARGLAVRMLKKLGFGTVEDASNGAIAVSRLKECGEGEFDLILCDLHMPDMDGIEVLRHFSEMKCRAHLVLMSGVDRRVLQTATELGTARGLSILGHIGKPIALPDLRTMAERLSTQQTKHAQTLQMSEPSIDEEDFKHALANGALRLHFQPKITITNRDFYGVEALSRWCCADHSWISPNHFIPFAEKSGLILPLTDFVIEHAIKQCSLWQNLGVKSRASINLPTVCLQQLDLPERIVAMSCDALVDPGLLTVEITESSLFDNQATSLDVLTRLRMKGIGLSIDDFGTGYSSMKQLKSIPFTELKIDRAFVHNAANDQSAKAILESSIDLAKRLGLVTVAEGVETDEDWDLVAELGCDMVQGYLISRAIAGDELPAWLAHWASRRDSLHLPERLNNRH